MAIVLGADIVVKHLLPIVLTGVMTMSSVWAGPYVELEVIVKDGDPAPGTSGAFDLSKVLVDSAAATAIDASGKVWFFTASDEVHPQIGTRSGIWSATGAFTDEIAINAQKLPQYQPLPADCQGIGVTCGMLFNTRSSFHVTASGQHKAGQDHKAKNLHNGFHSHTLPTATSQ